MALGVASATSTSGLCAPDLSSYTAVSQIWSWPECFVVAPDRRWLASMSDEGHVVQIIDNASGTILRTLTIARAYDTNRHNRKSPGIAITDNSENVVVRTDDGTTRAWKAGSGEMLPSTPDGVTFKPQAMTPEEDLAGAYKITTTMDGEGNETISIASGSKFIDAIHFQVPESRKCGFGGVTNVTFDGVELVFSRSSGNASTDDYKMPAIAYRLEHGAFHELWRTPCENQSLPGVLSKDEKFLSQTDGLVGPTKIWSLTTNSVVATFAEGDGYFAVAEDGETIVASTFRNSDDAKKTFTVLSHGKRSVFPRPDGDLQNLYLSPNGKWLAASTDAMTSVWSIPDGAQKPGRGGQAAGISNDGVLLERKTGKDSEYHGRGIVDGSGDGRWLATDDFSIFDARSGMIVAQLQGADLSVEDGHALIKQADGPMELFDLATERSIWTLKPTPEAFGYVMSFPNGCVEVSPGSEPFVRLVRGGESRPFDDAARRIFAKPGCKGIPAAIAASEKAFSVDRARIALIAKAEADEQARIRNAKEETARRERAALDAWRAGAPAREAEARRAAAMVSAATITLDAPDEARSSFIGKMTWHFSRGRNDADATGVVSVPGLGFQASLAIDKARPPAPEGSGVIAIRLDPDTSPGSHQPSVTTFGYSGFARPVLPSHVALHFNGPSGLPMLTRMDPADGNLELASLQPGTWIDIPLVVNDGRTARLSIEIGTVGRQVIDDVLAFKKAHP